LVRYHYHDHVCDRFNEAFTDNIGAWCEAHGIALTGHLEQEPELLGQTKIMGEAMRGYRKFELPGIAGTDAHREEYLGMACTEIDAEIRCNNDFIKAVMDGAAFRTSGTERAKTRSGKAKEHWTGVLGYKAYNRGIGKVRSVHRKLGHYRLTHTSDMADKFEKEWKEVKRAAKK